ncbi:carbonic anhydrase [Xylogone sp. PMI_703]|nr:carbonic anhydrase [Xylogone sp. PMI_703]
MAPPASIETLLERNKQYAASHVPIPTIPEGMASGDDAQRSILITCTDNRIQPELFLQLGRQDNIVISRNIGGRVATAMSTIMGYDAIAKLQDIIVIHHTDCGATYFTNEDIRKVHKERLPNHTEIDSMEFGVIKDVAQSVRDDLELLKTSPYIPKALADRAVGYVYDIKTGLLSPV